MSLLVHDVAEHVAASIRPRFDDWDVQWSGSDCRLFPKDEQSVELSLNDYVDQVLTEHSGMLLETAKQGAARTMSVAIYFDPQTVAAICPTLKAASMRRIADLGYDLELCLFPCSDAIERHQG
ncbi:hypothetical protein [Ensifer sp.]|uniref:hypothetical protein n=1 Tax=Ensifer sp. TaxID=1872086 RepID=UPI002E1367DF|nr:hypothetical protein [Ensifer sp.]